MTTHDLADLDSRLSAVRLRPGFLAFCSLVSQRLNAGGGSVADPDTGASDVLHMLIGIGAAPDVAWEILEGWGGRGEKAVARAARQLAPPVEISPAETAALRLSHYIPAWSLHDWPTLMRLAAEVAAEKKAN